MQYSEFEIIKLEGVMSGIWRFVDACQREGSFKKLLCTEQHLADVGFWIVLSDPCFFIGWKRNSREAFIIGQVSEAMFVLQLGGKTWFYSYALEWRI